MTTAIVVGGGFGGIAAALRLRAKGYAVTLIDRAPRLGGRAQVFLRGGFRHDAGPTVITAPFLIEELFALFGETMAEHLTLVPLTPWYRFRFPDGDTFDYGGTLEQTLAEIDRIEPADRDGYLRLLEHSRRIFDVGFTQLSAASFHRLPTMLAQIPALLRLRADRTVWRMVCAHLKSPKLRQAFSIQPLLVGGNPFDTTSIYGLIHYLERAYGVHFAMGGTGAIVDALGGLMARHGIAVRLNETVERITVAGGRATGVRLAAGPLAADVVVSNADAAYLYRQMVRPALSARAKLAAARYSMGLYVLYFGTTGSYPDVAHHTIWLGTRYRALLADIFGARALPEDFSLYLHRPTATDPSFAPPGCDSFYVLCPVPNLLAGTDWAVEGPRLRDRIVAALDSTILPGLSRTITAEFAMTPQDFADRYLSVHGAGFSVAPLFRQSAWFRFHNRAEGIANLYLVGAGTHPGAGLPGVLCSAKVIDALIPAASDHAVSGRAVSGRAVSGRAVSGRAVSGRAVSDDDMLAAKGRSFHWARRLLGQGHAARATRLYGFCRRVDDLADEAGSRDALDGVVAALRAGRSETAWIADALDLFATCGIAAEVPLALLHGVASDLGSVRIADEAALLRYCYRVAGTVGLMMAAALDARDPRAAAHAIDLGVAMQLTNICRDVAEDARAGRRYLPLPGMEPADLLIPDAPGVREAVTRLLDLADVYYASGAAGLPLLAPSARRAIGVAAQVYRGIGTRLRASGCDIWAGRAVVSGAGKAAITARALLRGPRAAPHDPALHAALVGLPGADAGPLAHAA